MTPFLWQVARHYLDAECLEDYCFVFPNRRSGQFFTRYLQEQLVAGNPKPRLLPSVMSINDLITELTATVTATDIEMMFALYDAYCRAMGDAAQEFDQFIYWAHLIIGDFNDIDKSLVNPDEIYQNLSDLHGLTSNYLSPEVQEQVKKIFGENLFSAFFDTSAEADLWQRRHERSQDDATAGDAQVKLEFMSLWNALAAIYRYYNEELDRRGVISPGRQLRLAAEGALKPLRYKRLVLVGFGVLSAAEVKLFERFKRDDKADFWWDNAGVGAMLDKAPHDPGALLIDGYCKRFGAMPIAPLETMEQTLRVVAVPSAVGQAKQAFNEVELMHQQGAGIGIDTAIVLPDENLLVPLLHSVHGVERLNVTLGYPLRSSGIVSLMHIVARMHTRASKEAGQWAYYREDVYDILSHPLIKTHFTHEALDLSAQLARTNRFRIPADEFKTLSFCDLFASAMDSEQSGDDHHKQAEYLDHLLAFCDLLMDRMQPADEAGNDEAGDGARDVELPLQQAFLVMYIDVLNQLKQSLAQCGRTLQHSSVFYLIDRLTASAIVPFTGEPLQGLQIMGLLETRNLDFKNVVILSMNERVFPRRRGINSFIPNYIRRAHGMSTIEQQEAIMAFNFYRLLNRASHVSLVYDSSIQAIGSSEPSRYITQLEKIYGKELKRVEMSPIVQTSSPISIQVPNNSADALRDRYTRDPQSAGGKYLSASAINKFIGCPLLFYLHYIQGLSDDNEVSDFMDYSTFGTIVHDTLNDCYDCEQLRAKGRVVDEQYLDWYRKNRLDSVVVDNIKLTYLHVPEAELPTDDKPLKGEAYMLIDTIKSYVEFVLDYDKQLIASTGGAFTVLECEETHSLLSMPIGEAAFNFTYKPDRIDRLADGTVRIVDYKTGSDPTEFTGLDQLFAPVSTSKGHCKAILQLFLYCYAYLQEFDDVEKVMPVIYKLSSMETSGVTLKNAGQYVFSMDDEIAKGFISRMGETVKALYEQDFKQAPDGSPSCNYCRFIDFCRRTPKRYS